MERDRERGGCHGKKDRRRERGGERGEERAGRRERGGERGKEREERRERGGERGKERGRERGLTWKKGQEKTEGKREGRRKGGLDWRGREQQYARHKAAGKHVLYVYQVQVLDVHPGYCESRKTNLAPKYKVAQFIAHKLRVIYGVKTAPPPSPV